MGEPFLPPYGRPQIDLFASHENYKLPTFCSRFFHPQAWATDALAIPWDILLSYAFSPFNLILTTLLKFSRSKGMMFLVAPCWPNQPWFPLILKLLVVRPSKLPTQGKILSQKKGQIFHQDLQSLHLTAWKLSTDASLREEFLRKLRTWQFSPGDSLLPELTIPDWPSSRSGQVLTLSIPWMLP